MAIVKAPELRNWLLQLNFTILTWQLNIGDWIEAGLDWAISWVNYVLSWAESAYSWARAAYNRAGELYSLAIAYINAVRQQLQAQISAWWSQLNTWWSARASEILSWLGALRDYLLSLLASLRSALSALQASWDNFRTGILPQLLNFSFWRSFWGATFGSIWDWWAPVRAVLFGAIEALLSPIRDQVNQHSAWLQELKDLIDDPETWLLDRLEKMLARFI